MVMSRVVKIRLKLDHLIKLEIISKICVHSIISCNVK